MKKICLIILAILITSCGKSSNSDSGSTEMVVASSTLRSPVSKTDPELEDVTHIVSSLPVFPNDDPGWKLTFEDNFDEPSVAISKGVDPECFSKTPTCMINWWSRESCPDYGSHLAKLNKCNWDVYHYYNYMDFDLPEGEGVNAFDPMQVVVKDGNLILSAEASTYSTINCKKPFHDPRINHQNYTIQCPILSGGVESRNHGPNNKYGFTQEYGRFEVRAILPNGPGSWPAHWLLPMQGVGDDGCGWPHSGEIDIMESWIKSDEKVKGGLIKGDCEKQVHLGKGFNWKAKSEFYPNLTYEQRKKTFFTDYHTYAVEWDSQKIRFLVDNIYIGQINKGDIIKNKHSPPGGLPIDMPSGPFYWILNTTIYKPEKEELRPVQSTFQKQEHKIDYVKVYKKCKPGEAGCTQFTYRNNQALCPGIREHLGDHNSKSICKAWPNFSLSFARCLEKGGTAVLNGEYCALDEGSWYKARSISGYCPWPREYVGFNGSYPVCKAWPHFKIKQSNCDGTIWNNYCIWSKGTWWRARELK